MPFDSENHRTVNRNSVVSDIIQHLIEDHIMAYFANNKPIRFHPKEIRADRRIVFVIAVKTETNAPTLIKALYLDMT